MAKRISEPGVAITSQPAALRIEDGAHYLGVSRSSAWRLIKSGSLPCVRLNGRTLLRRVDLDALLERSVEVAR
jgi:excisionase family DNA binding protein